MMAIQTDVALNRAGLDLELRDRIFGLWRGEQYHEAAELIPDAMMDAFLLCGTRDEVADRMTEYVVAGMQLPILQPVVPTQDQVDEILATAEMYGSAVFPSSAVFEPVGASATTAAAGSSVAAGEMSTARRGWRRIAAYYEIIRPFSFTASTVPVAAAGGLAALNGLFSWPLFLGALIGNVLLHIGTNVVNEVYDVRKGADRITSPRASHALLKGRVTEREALSLATVAFALAVAIGVWLTIEQGWPVIVLGLLGLVGGWG